MNYINAGKEESKKVRIIKRWIPVVLVVALLSAVIGAAWMGGYGMSKKKLDEKDKRIAELEKEKQELIDNPVIVTPVSPEIVLDTANKEIREIGELATVEYIFTNAAKFTDHKQIKDWNIPLTKKSFTLKWDGTIKAGIRVEQIRVELDEADNKLFITMPAAEILSYDTDENSVEVLDETNNRFNPITIDDKVKFDAATEADMKERAIDNGLLEKARKNAENIIGNLLKANPAIGDTYEIVFVQE